MGNSVWRRDTRERKIEREKGRGREGGEVMIEIWQRRRVRARNTFYKYTANRERQREGRRVRVVEIATTQSSFTAKQPSRDQSPPMFLRFRHIGELRIHRVDRERVHRRKAVGTSTPRTECPSTSDTTGSSFFLFSLDLKGPAHHDKGAFHKRGATHEERCPT